LRVDTLRALDRREGLTVRRRIACIAAFAFVATGTIGLVPAHARAAPGDRLWARRFNSPGPRDTTQDVPRAIVQGAHGTVFVVGNSGDYGYGPPEFIEALRPTDGSRLWLRRSRPGAWTAVSAAVSPDRATLFVGGSATSAHGEAFVVVAYRASTGQTLWRHRTELGPALGGDLPLLVVAPDGGSVFVGGEITTGTPTDYATDALIIRYDAATGAQGWMKHVIGSSRHYGYLSSLTMAPDGSTVFVDATVFRADDSDVVVKALDASTGARAWVSRFREPLTRCEERYASSGPTAITPDGARLIVTVAAHRPRCVGSYVETIAYDTSTGAVLWKRAFAPRTAMGDGDWPWDLSTNDTGSEALVLVNHASGPRRRESAIVLAYDTDDGTVRWHTRFRQPGSDVEGQAMTVASGKGQAYVTGSIAPRDRDTADWDVVTIAIGLTAGRTRWIRTYDAAIFGEGVDIVSDPRGQRLFVAARSYRDTTYADVVTIAYRI
jgi:hypothetical protein